MERARRNFQTLTTRPSFPRRSTHGLGHTHTHPNTHVLVSLAPPATGPSTCVSTSFHVTLPAISTLFFPICFLGTWRASPTPRRPSYQAGGAFPAPKAARLQRPSQSSYPAGPLCCWLLTRWLPRAGLRGACGGCERSLAAGLCLSLLLVAAAPVAR